MGLRLLLVSDNYPPFVGGAHRQTQLLARELARRGHAVAVATVWHGGLPEYELDPAGVEVYRLKQLRTWLPGTVRDRRQHYQPPWPDPISVWGLRRLIDRFQPDVVHAYGWFAYSAAAALLERRTPLLVSGRDYAYGCANRSLFTHNAMCSGPALRKCLDCASALYGPSKGWAAALGVLVSRPLLRRKVAGLHSVSSFVQAMTRRDFLDDRTAGAHGPLPHAVIPSFQEDEPVGGEAGLQPYLELLPSAPFILFVGALRLAKGLQPLLEAYAQLKTPPPLVLIGTAETDTPRSFPPGVLVLPSFPHRAVLAAWDRCLFGVLPSLWPEPLGSVVYEGMSRGKAVIGTSPGGHTDIVNSGENGLLVPAGDVAALRAAMQQLIDDPALRARLGQAGSQRAGLFTAEVSVPRFEQLYRQLLAAPHGGAPDNPAIPLRQV